MKENRYKVIKPKSGMAPYILDTQTGKVVPTSQATTDPRRLTQLAHRLEKGLKI